MVTFEKCQKLAEHFIHTYLSLWTKMKFGVNRQNQEQTAKLLVQGVRLSI